MISYMYFYIHLLQFYYKISFQLYESSKYNTSLLLYKFFIFFIFIILKYILFIINISSILNIINIIILYEVIK